MIVTYAEAADEDHPKLETEGGVAVLHNTSGDVKESIQAWGVAEGCPAVSAISMILAREQIQTIAREELTDMPISSRELDVTVTTTDGADGTTWVVIVISHENQAAMEKVLGIKNKMICGFKVAAFFPAAAMKEAAAKQPGVYARKKMNPRKELIIVQVRGLGQMSMRVFESASTAVEADLNNNIIGPNGAIEAVFVFPLEINHGQHDYTGSIRIGLSLENITVYDLKLSEFVPIKIPTAVGGPLDHTVKVSRSGGDIVIMTKGEKDQFCAAYCGMVTNPTRGKNHIETCPFYKTIKSSAGKIEQTPEEKQKKLTYATEVLAAFTSHADPFNDWDPATINKSKKEHQAKAKNDICRSWLNGSLARSSSNKDGLPKKIGEKCTLSNCKFAVPCLCLGTNFEVAIRQNHL